MHNAAHAAPSRRSPLPAARRRAAKDMPPAKAMRQGSTNAANKDLCFKASVKPDGSFGFYRRTRAETGPESGSERQSPSGNDDRC